GIGRPGGWAESKSLGATAYVLPLVSVALIDGAVRSPQLTATTMRLPAVLLAVNAAAIVEAATSLVAPAVCTKAIVPAGGFVTVSGVDPETEPRTAPMVAVPAPTLAASPWPPPLLLMVATPVADELQVTSVVTFCELPSLYAPLATYC